MNAQEQAKLAAYIAQNYYDDPAGYCRAVLGFDTDAWQEQVLSSVGRHRRTAVRSGHGVGKTRLAAAVIHWFMATRSYPQIVATANTLPQLSTKLWRELAKVQASAKNKELFQWTATRFYLKASPETWFAVAQPWTEHNSTAFAGTHEKNVLMVFDESSEIPPIIWDVASGAMSTEGARWLSLGNPTMNTGKFHECFGKNKMENFDADDGRWNAFTINAEDYVRPNGQVDAGYIAEQLREVEGDRDHDFYRIRVRGLPPKQAANQFISEELFDNAIGRTVGENQMAARILGVDVARFGEDRTTFVAKWGMKMHVVGIFRGQDTMKTAGAVIAELERAKKKGEKPYDYVCVDDIGVGGGVTDRLKEQGIKVLPVIAGAKPFDSVHYVRLRDELWDAYKDWLATGSVDAKLKDDTCSINYEFVSSGKLNMESKDHMKERGLPSPDIADAACLCFYAPNKATDSKPTTPPRTLPRYMTGGR